MAITKTIFTGATVADQASEVLAWLQANATTYFDSITYNSETSTIICEKDSEVALVLYFIHDTNNTFLAKAYLKNGNSANLSRAGGTAFLYNYGIVTSYGIILFLGDNSNYSDWIFITKTQSDSLCITLLGAGGVGTATAPSGTAFISGDFENSLNYNSYVSGGSTSGATTVKNWLSQAAYLTGLLPLTMVDCPSYTPNFYIERFNEYTGIVGKMIIGNDEYFSNGYIAMKG